MRCRLCVCVCVCVCKYHLVIQAQSICHTATCTSSAVLSAVARLPSMECSFQEATYLSIGKTSLVPRLLPMLHAESATLKNWEEPGDEAKEKR